MRSQYDYNVSDPWEKSSVTFDATDVAVPSSRLIPAVTPFKSHSDRSGA